MFTKVNSTGSFWKDGDNNYWSYNTQLTYNYKGYRLVNRTFYSITTRKHQSQITRQDNDIDFFSNHYGYIKPEQDLKYYLQELKKQLNKLNNTRNSKYKQTKINDCQKQIDTIEKVLDI